MTLFYVGGDHPTFHQLPAGARVRVTFIGDAVRDFAGRPIDPDGDGLPGGAVTIDFDTLNLAPLPGTSIYGRVFASELLIRTNSSTNIALNVELPGVTITVEGMEDTMRVVTGSRGEFTMTNVPGGHFFAYVNGHTVTDFSRGIRWPDQSYYPAVVEKWESIPGTAVNVGGKRGAITRQ